MASCRFFWVRISTFRKQLSALVLFFRNSPTPRFVL
jgi:hypothetical protein